MPRPAHSSGPTDQWAAYRVDVTVRSPGPRGPHVLVYSETPLPLNVLATLSGDWLDRIFAPRSGQQRIDELFRVVQGRPVSAAVLRTVAMNEDAAKRVRDTRRRLRAEGLLILSGSSEAHRSVLDYLGVGGAPPGRWTVSVRVIADPASDGSSVELAGRRWRLARPDEAVGEAPELPYMFVREVPSR